METKEFMRMVMRNIEAQSDNVCSIDDVPKINQTLTALSVKSPVTDMATVYYEDFFKDAYDAGKDANDVARYILKHVSGMMPPISAEGAKNLMSSYEAAKDFVFPRLISGGNDSYCEKYANMDFLNLKICFYVSNNNEFSIPVSWEIVDKWNVSVEKIKKQAFKNLAERKPANLMSMAKMCASMGMPEAAEMQGLDDKIFIACDESKRYSAVCIADVNNLREFHKVVGGNYYVLPSSLHEVIIVKDDDDADAAFLETMVSNVNAEVLDAEDILSDSVYYFNGSKLCVA